MAGTMSNQGTQDLSPCWCKAKIISGVIGALGTVFIPIMIAYFAGVHSDALKESEIRVRYVEFAINILREDPEKQKMQELRIWAIEVVNKYSKIQLPEKVRQELIKKQLRVKVENVTSVGIGSTIVGDKVIGD